MLTFLQSCMLQSMVNLIGRRVKTEKSTPIEAVTVPIFRKSNLSVGRALFKQTPTSIKPNRQPRGPDWAKALPLDRNRPVPIIPARAIMVKLRIEGDQ
jgi:hypothetical protein